MMIRGCMRRPGRERRSGPIVERGISSGCGKAGFLGFRNERGDVHRHEGRLDPRE